LATGVSWRKGHNSQLQHRIVTLGTFYSSIDSPESGQQASVLYELWLRRGLVFSFLQRGKWLPITV